MTKTQKIIFISVFIILLTIGSFEIVSKLISYGYFI